MSVFCHHQTWGPKVKNLKVTNFRSCVALDPLSQSVFTTVLEGVYVHFTEEEMEAPRGGAQGQPKRPRWRQNAPLGWRGSYLGPFCCTTLVSVLLDTDPSLPSLLLSWDRPSFHSLCRTPGDNEGRAWKGPDFLIWGSPRFQITPPLWALCLFPNILAPGLFPV